MASNSLESETSGSASFMSLPPEIRVKIFALLVVSACPLELGPDMDISTLAALSMTSKLIRKEVLHVFFSENTFCVSGTALGISRLLKAPVSFIARMRWLEIEYPLVEEGFHDLQHAGRHLYFGESQCLMNAVKMMKRLKGCTIVVQECIRDCRWSKDRITMSEVELGADGCNDRKRQLFALLKMSKACELNILVKNIHGEAESIDTKVMESAREAHQEYGMDWSWFLQMKSRQGETW